MAASPGAPIVIYSNGIPISPSDLDFGNVATQAQINALSSFSQMVNAIPAPGNVWVPTGSETWSIYNLVLTMSEFAQSAPPPVPPPIPTRSVAVSGSDANLNVPNPSSQAISEIPTILENIGSAIFPALSYIGFEIGEKGSSASGGTTTANSNAAQPPETSAPDSGGGLAAIFLQLEGQLNVDTMTDTLGNAFYPTYLYPADFYQSQYDASWKPFTVTPGEDDPWIPVGEQSSTVSGEIITLPLSRSWWSTWIFANRGWQFNPTSGFGKLSDGGVPPQGMMPMYASALIIARNLQFSQPADAAAPPQDLNPFILAADAGAAAKGSSSADAATAPISPVPSDSMLIIGFVCTPLPLSPNPDPSLNWG